MRKGWSKEEEKRLGRREEARKGEQFIYWHGGEKELNPTFWVFKRPDDKKRSTNKSTVDWEVPLMTFCVQALKLWSFSSSNETLSDSP